jgi:type I restriction enzyme S subunit
LGKVIQQRRDFIFIDDFTEYKRCRVQLHAQGIVLRDTVSGAEIKTKNQQICKAGDFLVAEIDAKVGGFGIVPDDLDRAIVSSHYFLFEVDEGKLNRRFLDYFIRTPAFGDQVTAQGSTNYAAIRPNDVLGYEVPLPPLPEQQRVLARIEELAAKINEARGLRQKVQTEQDLFSMKQIESIFSPFQNKMVCIGDVFRVTTGGTPSRGNPTYWNGDLSWVSSGEVAFCRIKQTYENITREGVENSNAKVNPPRTVLLAMIGQGKTRGQCAILDCYAATNQNVAAIHAYETEHLPEYLYWWLFANYQKNRATETGTAQPALSGERVKQIRMPIAPVDEQRRVVSELDALQVQVDALKKLQAETAVELDALLPSILDKAFQGKL